MSKHDDFINKPDLLTKQSMLQNYKTYSAGYNLAVLLVFLAMVFWPWLEL